MIVKYLLAGAIIFSFVQCASNNPDDPGGQIDCAVVLCTAEFVTISIAVEDADGVKVVLEDFEVTDSGTGKTISREYTEEEMELFRQTGIYPIYDDSFGDEHLNMERTIIFRGMINGEEVVTGNYVVFANCCHVSLLSGENPLIIN